MEKFIRFSFVTMLFFQQNFLYNEKINFKRYCSSNFKIVGKTNVSFRSIIRSCYVIDKSILAQFKKKRKYLMHNNAQTFIQLKVFLLQ